MKEIRAVHGLAAVLMLSAMMGVVALPAEAASPAKAKASAARIDIDIDIVVAEFDRAMDEQRLVDAGRILDQALVADLKDSRLALCAGELHLAKGRYEDAVRSFALAERTTALHARALQGRGIALTQLGRAKEAEVVLRQAAAADPTLWRAWNALAVGADRRGDWVSAEDAYTKALSAPTAAVAVYNNRGYSRLLQGRLTEASSDFVDALAKDPNLAVARTNLRLTMALRGDYARATSVGDKGQKAAVLNNAGFAAVVRGELDTAEQLFQQAISARGATYGRAFENLEMVYQLKAGQANLAR